MQRLKYGTRATIVLMIGTLLALTVPLTPVHAATRIVTKLADDGTSGTLRRAVDGAQPGDTIIFASNVTGTITLTEALTLNVNLTIQGPGAGMLRVAGNGRDRVFTVAAESTISGLTITGGGGGIYNTNTLTLTNSVVSGNIATDEGGGIVNIGVLTVTNSTISGNSTTNGGGGIFTSDGSVTVTNSTISGNSTASNAGGIGTAGDGVATVTNSTISGNTATGDAGGIEASSNEIFTLVNSTVSGNKAGRDGGGIDAAAGTLIARNVTVANNTAGSLAGGVYQNGFLDIGNSLLAGNTAPVGPDYGVKVPVTVINRGNNFIAADAGSFPAQPSDSIGTGATVLGPLGDNGGPTQTHALLPGSTPVDKGSNALCAEASVGNKDQRGVTRPQGTVCDIGAFELAGAVIAGTVPPTIVPNAAQPTIVAGTVPPTIVAPVAPAARPTIVPGASTTRVSGGQVLDPAPTAMYQQPAAGNRCVAIDVTLTNTGPQAELYTATFSSLTMRDGQLFTPTFTCSNAQPQITGGMLQPGASVRGYVLFEVPQGATLAVYEYRDDVGRLAGAFRF